MSIRSVRALVASAITVAVGVPWLIPSGGPAAVAAAFTVTTVVDAHDADPDDGVCDIGSGACSLRAAVEQANHLGGSHTITLGPGVHTLGNGAASAAGVDVTADVTVVGAGRDVTTIQVDASPGTAAFLVLEGASLTIETMTLTQTPGFPSHTGVRLDGDGAALHASDVAFLRFWRAAVSAGTQGSGYETDPVGIDVVLEDVLIDGDGEMGFGASITSGGNATVDLIRTHVRHAFSVSLDHESPAAGAAGDRLRVVDSVIEGTGQFDSGVTGLIAYGGFETEIVGTRIAGLYEGIDVEGAALTIRDTVVEDVSEVGVRLHPVSGAGDAALLVETSTIRRIDGPALEVDGAVTLRGTTVTETTTAGYLADGNPPALIESSTITGNGDVGIVLPTGSTLRNVTITDNGRVGAQAGNVGLYVEGEVTLHNTVVAGNHDDCWDAGPGGSMTVLGDHNVDGDGSCGLSGASDRTVADPMLAPLADNGGPTATHAPLPGSPLVDTGDDAECPTADQRGAPRPFDGDGDGTATCDVGAVEVGGDIATSTTVTWSASAARRGHVAPDAPLVIEARSVPGGSATATVELTSWYPDADPSEPVADAPAPATVEVALTEGAAGVYTGSLPLDGVAEITAIAATVSAGGGDRVGTATTGLPLRVAGAVEVTTALGVPPWTVPSTRALLVSASTADGDSLLVQTDDTVTSRWLRPADDYTVEIVDGEHRRIAGPVAVAVRGGLVTPVVVDADVLPHVPFSLVVADTNGFPVEGVKVTVTDDTTGDEVAKTVTGADGRVEAVARGADVHVHVDPLDLPFTATDAAIELTELGEEVEVEVGAALPTAVVSGVVEHPERPPVPGARVTLVTEVGGRAFTTATTTGEDGTYSAVALQGDVTVSVDEPRAGKASVTTAVAGDTTVDLLLQGPLMIDVTIDLRTRYAGDAAPTPIDVDSTTGHHFHLELHQGRQRTRVRAGVVSVPYHAGESLALCGNGYEADLPAACTDVTVDVPTQTATASLLLEQTGAVSGALSWTSVSFVQDQTYRPDLRGHVFRVDGTALTKVSSFRPVVRSDPATSGAQSAEFHVPVFEPGTYELRFELHEHVVTPCQNIPGGDPVCGDRWAGSTFAQVRTTVGMDGVLDVGTLPFGVAGQRFTSSPESNVTVSPDVVLPGDTAKVRVSAHNSSQDTVEAAAFEVDVPAGATLVPGSVTVGGTPVAASVTDGVLTVPVGDVASGETVVATAWLAVDTGFAVDSLSVAASITHSLGSDPLGSGAAIVRRLSLNSVERTAEFPVPVWGRSLPGSVVEVTVDGAVVGTAVTSPGGFWSTIVTLPEVPLPRTFVLAAHTEGTSGTISTPGHVVAYDAAHPTLRRAVMQQAGGRVVEIDPRRGLAQFPYVFVPNEPIHVDLEFDQPFGILPPVVYVGARRATARYDTATGLWRATVEPTFRELGEIRVSWEPVPVTVDLAPAVPQRQLTAEETRAMLPVELRTFSEVEVVDPTPGALAATATFPDHGDVDAGGTTTDITVTTESIMYEPTAADLELQATSGVPMWDLRIEWIEREDDEVDLEVSFVVPDDALDPGVHGYGPAPRQAASSASKLFKLVWKDVDKLKLAWQTSDSTSGAASALNSDEYLDKLDLLRQRIEAVCAAGDAAPLLAELELLAELFMGTLGVNAALMLIGLVAGPETLGLGTLAAWGIAFAIDKLMSAILDQELDQLRDKVADRCDTDPDDEDDDETAEEARRDADCAPEWALVPAALGGPNCHPIADPTYIYDPSGFVYEVLEESRLEGVTATLETAADPGGPWTIWDAEWFLQENPLTTDADGRYAWDVPEGWWRVRWDKAGYETQYSDALEVLPPHFDVNADLRNLTPPTVASATGTAGGSTVEVVFDQWMDVDFVTGETLVVTDPLAEEWTVTPVDAATTTGGDAVATTFAVDLGRPLVAGEQLTLGVDVVVRSASDVPVDPSTEVDVTVSAAPPASQTITFAPIADVVYGVAPIAVAPTASSGLPVSLSASGPCSVAGGSIVVSGVGTCTVTASQGGSSKWQAAAPVHREFAIARRPLTVRAHSRTSRVGEPRPTFGATATGLVAPDTLGSLGGLVCSSTAPSAGGELTKAGTYTVTCSGLKAPNYRVSYVAGTHTVAPAPGGGTKPGGGTTPSAPAVRTVVPARLLETRRGAGSETVDHDFEGVGRVAARSVIAVDVAGRGGVPGSVGAVMLNVTAIRPSDAGYLTVFPCDEDPPLASNVNYTAGQVIPNAVLAKVAGDGTVCVYTWAETDLVVDVNGYVPVGGSPDPVVPARLLDTRRGPGAETVDHQLEGVGRVVAGTAIELPVAGRGGVPDDAVAAMLNVTAVRPDDRGYLTVYPCDEPRPLASNVNYLSPQVVPNAVLAKLSAAGTVCIYTHATTDVVVDVNGFVREGGAPEPLVPARIVETRRGPGLDTIDGRFEGGGRVGAGKVLAVDVAGRGGVPGDVATVMLNVTAVRPSDSGYLTVFPCDAPRPLASNVNYTAGQVIPNAVLAKVAADGTVCIFTWAETDLVVDVNGYRT